MARTLNNAETFLNKKYNKLTITQDLGLINGYRRVMAICECGKSKECVLNNIKRGKIKSCGCLKTEIKHGLSNHPLYIIWSSIIHRCYDIKHDSYKYYGGRGVRVSSRWIDNFKAFYEWAITHGWRKGLQIDKDIRSGGKIGDFYCPELCCFIPSKVNCRNRSNNVALFHDGQSLCLSEWSEKLGISPKTINTRKRLGWSDEEILTTPVKKYNSRCR